MVRSLLILAVALYAAPATAGSVVATPALDPPTGGSIRCIISNASDKKPITVELTVYDNNSNAVFGPVVTILDPFENTETGSSISAQSACVVKVLKGSSKSLRVALYAEDSSGNIAAAVGGR